jgi:hypothetical protein
VILIGKDPPKLGSIWRSILSAAIALPQQAQAYFQSARKLTTFAVHHRNQALFQYLLSASARFMIFPYKLINRSITVG